MIYNLSKFISDNSSLTPITNGADVDSPDEAVILLLTGGEDNSRGLKVDWTVQFLSRYFDRNVSYEQIKIVYNLLKNRFGVTLPEVTVNSVLYPEIITSRMIPIQTPGYIGADDNGRHQWSVNLQITTGEK